MDKMRRWVAIGACIAALTTIAGCGDDDSTGTDAGETPTDSGSMPMDGGGPVDGGRDAGTDPCEGRTLCETAGTSCDGEVVVTCEEDEDGCLVETRNDCAIESEVCEVEAGDAACIDPCSLLPAELRCDAEGRSCDGDTLEVCAADAMGCLVVTTTDCTTETTDGVCNPAGGTGGDMAVCEGPGDPCAGVTQCGTAESRACSGDNTAVVACAMDAMGCFVETTTTCTSPQVCDATSGTATCVTPRGANNSCATAESITATRTITGEDLALGGARPQGTDCGSSSGDNALYYSVTIPPLTRVEVQTAPSIDIVLLTQDSCGAAACTFRTDSSPERGTLVNVTDAPITRIVAIHNYFDGTVGTYDITFTYSSLAMNAACGTATSITGTTSLTGESTMLGGVRPSGSGCNQSSGFGAVYYAVTVPAGGVVDVVTAGSFDRVLTVQNACGGSECTVYTDSSPESTRLANPGATDIVQIVAVYPYSTSGLGGTFDISFTYVTPAGNASCAGATRVETDSTLTGEDISAGSARPRGTGCRSSGSETALYYEVVIPALSSVVVTATAASGSDISLVAQSTCGVAEACTHSTDSSPETIRLANSTTSPVSRFVAVHGSGTRLTGTFDIAFDFESLAANASCASAQEVTTNVTFTGESTALGGARPSGTGCAANQTGDGALYYEVSVDPGFAVDVTTAGSLDRVLVTLDACDATACTFATDAAPETARIVNSTGATITRLVAIHPYSTTASGTFDVTFTYVEVADNATCGSATMITEGSAPLTGENLAQGGPRPVGTGCSTGGGNSALYYAVSIPPLRSVDVVATPAAGGDIVLLTQDSCAVNACSSRSDVSGAERARLVNTGGTTITRYVAVHSASSSTSPTFGIAFNYAAIAANAVCSSAQAISGDRTITGENLALGGPRPQGTGCTTVTGNSALYYEVTVPAQRAVDVTATPGAGVNIALAVQDACGAATCSASSNAASDGVERTTIVNSTATDFTRVIAVFNNAPPATGTFQITFDEREFVCGDGRIEGAEVCDDGTPGGGDGCSATCTVEPNFICTGTPSVCRAVATNAFCAGAAAVTGTVTLTGESAAAGGPRPEGTGCGTGTGASQSRALYYAVSIPPQTRVQVTTAGSLDRVLLTQDACDATTCGYRTDTSPESARLRNDSTTETLTRIVVIHPASATTGTWDVTFTYQPYACGDGVVDGSETCDDANATAGDGCDACVLASGYACVGEPGVCVSGAASNAYCADAEPVTATTVLSGESTAGGGPRPTGTGCGFGAGARAVYYAVTIPPARAVDVVTSSISGDIVLFTQNDCADLGCTFSTDSSPERTRIENRGTTTITRIVGVRSYGTSSSTFNIAFNYDGIFTAIAGACVDTAGGAAVTLSGDDSVTSSATLPFAFSFAGAAVTHWTASTNGLLQLRGASFSGATDYSNSSIPNSSTPNGFVAAFWDDLSMAAGGLRTLTSGEAGSRRFVVEWTASVLAVSGSQVRFQAHLFEGTNAIELHYCSASGTDAALLGSGATFGIENQGGTSGAQISHNTAGTATPGNGYRYVP